MIRPSRGMLLLVLSLAPWLRGQIAASATAEPQVSFKFEHVVPGVAVPRYQIHIGASGTGLYHAEVPVPPSTEVQIVDHPLLFTPGTVKTVFNLIQLLNGTDVVCASKAKNIADTGTKTLEYDDGGHRSTCTYNFSEQKAVVQLTEIFQRIEFTLEEGRALDFKHRFDRLGLDAEMAALATAVDDGHALELRNITQTLRSIAGDTELIQRVRLRAAKLLDRAQSGT